MSSSSRPPDRRPQPHRQRLGLRALTRRRAPGWAPALALVVLILAVELGVRSVEDWLPVSQAGDAAEVELKWDQIHSLEEAGERTDVVFFGNSAMDAAIDPAVWAEASISYPLAYNASLLGQPFDSMRRWAQDYVLPHCDAATVVIGVTPFDVPQIDILNTNRALVERLFDDAMNRLEDKPLARADRRLRDRSAIVRNRASFRSPVRLYRAVKARVADDPRSKQDSLQAVVLADGRTVLRTPEVWEDDLLQARGGVANYWGVPESMPLGFTFESAVQRQVFRSSRTTPTQLDALRASAEDTGADVIFVIPPSRPDAYIGFTGSQAATEAAEANVRRIGEDMGVPVLDFSGVGYPADHFADPVHLNRRGSERFSRALARAIDEL